MKIGQAVALLLVAGYLAFELTALARARPRMEPDYIYQSMISARTGVERCGDPPEEQVGDFNAELERMRGRVREKFAADASAPDSTEIERRIAALTGSAEAEASATLDVEGCDSFTARRLVQRHKMHARR